MYNDNKCQSYYDDNKNFIKLTPINARELRVSFGGNYKTVTDKAGNIIELDIFSRKFNIGQTEKVIAGSINHYYKVNYITPYQLLENVATFTLHVDLISNTTYFLFPIIAEIGYDWLSEYLINAYINISVEDVTSYINGPYIYLYYKCTGEEVFYNFEKMLEEHDLVKEIINIDLSNILVVVELPERFIDDYNIIKTSKYSKSSRELKDRVLNFYNFNEDSIMYHVFEKTEQRRRSLSESIETDISVDAELWQSMDNPKETFRIELLTNYTQTII